MKFEFSTSGNIRFGCGLVKETRTIAAKFGKQLLVITGKTISRISPVLADLESGNMTVEVFSVEGEPTISTIESALKIARKRSFDVVIGIGGGSVLDAGKAIAALLANPGEVMDYLEIVGKGKPLKNPSLPFIAIPTTSGTGSEVTRNAVIASPEHSVKISMRSPSMLPAMVIADPELTLSVSPATTATTGMDALVQLMEAFVSVKSNPVTDAISKEGLFHAANSLLTCYRDGKNLQARTKMALASMLSGMALANAGLGAVHGFAGPVGGMFKISHGDICACLLPAVMRINHQALNDRLSNSTALRKYDKIATILTGNKQAVFKDGVQWIDHLCRELKIPTLSKLGIGKDHLETIVCKAKSAGSMKGNPILLTDTELKEILLQSF